MTSRTLFLLRRTLSGGVVLAALVALQSPSAGLTDQITLVSGRTVDRTGDCRQGGGQWDLKAKSLAGHRLYVEFEIDQIPRGSRWQLFVTDNGTRLAAVSRIARTSRGVQVSRITHNRLGRDRIRAGAVNPRSGSSCFGRLRF